jgi:hypothetical protein
MARFFLIIFIFTSFSYAGFGDFLKSAGEYLEKNTGKTSCPEKVQDECARLGGENSYYDLWCNPDGPNAKPYISNGNVEMSRYIMTEEGFRKCQDYIKKCECSQNPDIPGIKEALSVSERKREQRQKQEQVQREEQASQELNVWHRPIKTETQNQAILDSIKLEIYALIKSGAETALILDKCKEYNIASASWNSLQTCKAIQNSIEYQQNITEVTALLKANELEECIHVCNELEKLGYSDDEKFLNLCRKQLVDKVRKIPLKKLNSNLASVYFYNEYAGDEAAFPAGIPKKNAYLEFGGIVIQNTGKTALLSTSPYDFIVKHSGQCTFVEKMWFQGYGKYLGMETYTTVLGVRRTLPAVQLLWCE